MGSPFEPIDAPARSSEVSSHNKFFQVLTSWAEEVISRIYFPVLGACTRKVLSTQPNFAFAARLSLFITQCSLYCPASMMLIAVIDTTPFSWQLLMSFWIGYVISYVFIVRNPGVLTVITKKPLRVLKWTFEVHID